MSDLRWTYGMNGWRVLVVESRFTGRQGEVTGYDSDQQYVYVVLDGEEDVRWFGWDEVRPA